eukprot:432753_1
MTTVVVKCCTVLNHNVNSSTISPQALIVNGRNVDIDSYIVSDEDEEMLILIEFKTQIELKYITIYAKSNNQENVVDEKKDENIDTKEQHTVYNDEIVDQMVKLNLGTREQAIEASKMSINYNDPNEVAQVLHTIKSKNKKINTTVSSPPKLIHV